MERIGRLLTVAGAAGMMVWMTSCSKPAEPTGATAPGGLPVAADKGQPAADGKPAAEAKPAEGGSELEQLKGKIKGIKSYELSMNAQGQDMTIKAKLADGKPEKMRIDNPKMGGYMIYDLSTKSIYMVNDKTNEAMKMTLSAEQTKDMPDNVGDSIDLVIKQNPKLSSEKIDDVDCWKAVTGTGKEESTVWMDKENGLPRQVKNGEQTMKMNYKNINKVADKEFELPKGIKIKDMGDMSKNMPGKAK